MARGPSKSMLELFKPSAVEGGNRTFQQFLYSIALYCQTLNSQTSFQLLSPHALPLAGATASKNRIVSIVYSQKPTCHNGIGAL
jgi:hypothetical protein